MHRAPGATFLLAYLPRLFAPALAVYASSVVASRFYSIHVHGAIVAVAAVLSLPTVAIIRNLHTQIRQRKEMGQMGAVPVPVVKGKWPGNLDLLLEVMHSARHGYPGDGLPEKLARYGHTFNLRILWEDLIFTIVPEHVKTILATDFNNYVKGEKFITAMDDLLGVGVFNSDGSMWKFHRGLTRPFFARERIVDFETFNTHSNTAIVKIQERIAEGQPFDAQDLYSRFTIDSATEFLFGSCVHALYAPLPYSQNSGLRPKLSHISDEFSSSFAKVQFTVADRARMGTIWPVTELGGNATSEHMKVIYKFIDPILKDAMRKKAEGLHLNEKEETSGHTLLDHLVSMSDDPKVIRDELLNILLAGRDTTASLLTSVTYFLAMHPEVLQRLRKEILDVVGSSRPPTPDDIREMKFMRAVLNETLRLMPPVPFNVRESVNASTLTGEDGKQLYIPAGTQVLYSVWMMHKNTKYWGPDAEIFDPNRFLDERVGKYLVANNFIFVPFNAGPRICLGQQFAYNEASFFLVKLLQNFSGITLAPEAQPKGTTPPASWAKEPGRKGIEKIWVKNHLTLYSDGGLWVRMVEATNSEVV